MTNQPPTLASLTTSLTTQNLPAPHQSFLRTILTPASQTKLLAVLTATAKHRLLASDITSADILALSTASLPPTLNNVRIVNTSIQNDTFVQILDILDLGRSKWDQIEALESERKGETTKGREVIRVLPQVENAEHDRGSTAATQVQAPTRTPHPTQSISRGPHKLLLQDFKGNKIWAFELKPVPKIGIGGGTGGGGGISIGCKIWLKKGCKVARGMVMLEPGSCMILGGKIEGLDKSWREGREQRLREEVERERADGARGGAE
ncbi:uncharacterized protein PAC_07492 [Phialocephala subalpina]|uniref:RecQ mediated genome instability protein 1 OB-fold domain-containing protein n=1 Tax=Phialocephala subalpina TaxID=576137 RepID=A0A1L7WXV7_9HELO|nr:uncharacterized protein PAC_07492 [Phialocephala subalpina]